MIKFYGYKKCATSRKGEKALQDYGVDYKFIDVTENPPAKTTLKKMIKQSGEDVKKFINTSGAEYKKQQLKEKIPQMKESEIIEMLAANGRLLKRPIVTDGSQTTVGFDSERFQTTWG